MLVDLRLTNKVDSVILEFHFSQGIVDYYMPAGHSHCHCRGGINDSMCLMLSYTAPKNTSVGFYTAIVVNFLSGTKANVAS